MILFAYVVLVATVCFVVSCSERLLCQTVASQDWWLVRKLDLAVERLYYLRDATGTMLYVGQTVDEERRWGQHVADGRKVGTRKADWACLVDKPHCTVVRLCWTHKQVMRIERRRTLAIYYFFAAWNFCGKEDPVQLANTSNTPWDERQPPKLAESVVACLFAPLYWAESWMVPEAQWHRPLDQSELA